MKKTKIKRLPKADPVITHAELVKSLKDNRGTVVPALAAKYLSSKN